MLEKTDLENIDLWHQCAEQVKRDHQGFEGAIFRRQVIRNLIDMEVENVVESTAARIEEAGVQSADEVRACEHSLAGYGDELRSANVQLYEYLYQNLYFHPTVAEPNNQGGKMIEKVFGYYIEHPDKMGETSVARIESEGLERTVCDYVSGMTDRFLIAEAECCG